jgi:hypothetical protein
MREYTTCTRIPSKYTYGRTEARPHDITFLRIGYLAVPNTLH